MERIFVFLVSVFVVLSDEDFSKMPPLPEDTTHTPQHTTLVCTLPSRQTAPRHTTLVCTLTVTTDGSTTHHNTIVCFWLYSAIEMKKSKGDLMNINSNHVNLSLETALVFDPKDTYYDVSLIRTLRTFLDSLQNAITSKVQLRTSSKDNFRLSDFLYEIGVYIIKYSDEHIKSAAVALQNVVEDYYPSGTVYHKIIFDPRLKAFIKNTLKEWAITDPKILRAGLKTMYDGPSYDEVFVDLVQNLNCLFDKEDSRTLQNYAKRFAVFPSKLTKLESNIDKALNFIVFDRYEMLNFSMRSFVVEELSKISEFVMFAFKNRSGDPEFFMRKRMNNNTLTLQDIVSRSKIDRNSEFSGSGREDFAFNPNNSLEEITKTSDEDREEDKNDIEREIVLNKAIEINVIKNADDAKDKDYENRRAYDQSSHNNITNKRMF